MVLSVKHSLVLNSIGKLQFLGQVRPLSSTSLRSTSPLHHQTQFLHLQCDTSIRRGPQLHAVPNSDEELRRLMQVHPDHVLQQGARGLKITLGKCIATKFAVA